jgi:uncharacterized protein (TIGR02996 family)
MIHVCESELARENDLISACAHDRQSLPVYADWLEERGDVTRAIFVRLWYTWPAARSKLPVALRRDAIHAFREKASELDPDWLDRIGYTLGLPVPPADRDDLLMSFVNFGQPPP